MRSRSGFCWATWIACRPIEPVEPRTVTSRGSLTGRSSPTARRAVPAGFPCGPTGKMHRVTTRVNQPGREEGVVRADEHPVEHERPEDWGWHGEMGKWGRRTWWIA